MEDSLLALLGLLLYVTRILRGGLFMIDDITLSHLLFPLH
jgi:hypothetical protein